MGLIKNLIFFNDSWREDYGITFRNLRFLIFFYKILASDLFRYIQSFLMNLMDANFIDKSFDSQRQPPGSIFSFFEGGYLDVQIRFIRFLKLQFY